jgi:hypothetical protein
MIAQRRVWPLDFAACHRDGGVAPETQATRNSVRSAGPVEGQAETFEVNPARHGVSLRVSSRHQTRKIAWLVNGFLNQHLVSTPFI